ncbi:MAG: hypothetical protein ACRDSE_11080, partial [Pseudonocardiaceae bacterium]
RSGGALVRDSSVDDRTCHLHRMGELVTRSGSQAHPWLSALVLYQILHCAKMSRAASGIRETWYEHRAGVRRIVASSLVSHDVL